MELYTHNDITIFMDVHRNITVEQWSWNKGGSGTYVNGTSSTDDTTYYIYVTQEHRY